MDFSASLSGFNIIDVPCRLCVCYVYGINYIMKNSFSTRDYYSQVKCEGSKGSKEKERMLSA